jgi:hypothetical protein
MLAQHAYGCTSLAAACDETEARCDLRFSLSQLVTQRHLRGRNATSSAGRSPPSKKKGAGKCRKLAAPMARLQNEKLAAVTIQGSAGSPGIPCMMVLTLISRSPWGPGFLASIASCIIMRKASASGGQDHTILRRHRSSARTGRARRDSVHRIPRSRSVRFGHNAPHKSRRDMRIMLPISRNGQAYFRKSELARHDGQSAHDAYAQHVRPAKSPNN